MSMSMDLRAPLTPNFAHWEFVVSETAARRGIGNTPTPEHWERLKALATNVLEPCRVACGPLRITSGYRSPALNTAIGGAPMSQHCFGEAVDIIPVADRLEKVFVWLYKNAPFDQLIWEFSEWIHVSHKLSGSQRGTVLLAHKSDGKTVYAPITREQMSGW